MPKDSGKFGYFLPWGDSEDVKTAYAEPNIDPFYALRFQHI